MNRICFIFFLLHLFLIQSCVTKKWHNPLEQTLTQQEATEELRTLTGVLQRAHPSLYLYVSKNGFQQIADSIQATIKNDITVAQLYSKYAFLINTVGCSHTSVEYPGYIYDTLQNKEWFFPYSLKLIEGKIVVNNIGYDLPQGTEIKDINGVPVSKLLDNIYYYYTIDGRARYCQKELATEDFALYYFYRYGKQTQFKMTITDTNGVTKYVTEKPVSLKEWNARDYDYKYYYDQTGVDYDLYFTSKEDCAVIRLCTFKYEEQEKQQAFENFCSNTFDLLSRKPSVKKLVIDLRENTGGELYNCFLLYSYLAPKPFNEYEKVVSKINHIPYPELLDEDFAERQDDINNRIKSDFTSSNTSGYYIYADTLIQKWEPQGRHFNGDVYVVTNPRVSSSASYFSLLVKNSHTGKIVGEETSGSASAGNGFSILEYTMPKSKIKLLLPYAHLVYTYKDINTGQGVRPDYYIPDNLESFKKNKDRQITFINDSLNKN